MDVYSVQCFIDKTWLSDIAMTFVYHEQGLKEPRRQWIFTVYSDITDIMYTTFYTQLRAVTCSAQWNCYFSLLSRRFGMFSFLSRHIWLKCFGFTLYKVSSIDIVRSLFAGTRFFSFLCIFTVRNNSCGKVIFSQVSVCLQGEVYTPPRQTPPQQTPPQADTSPRQTSPRQTHPLDRHIP